MTDRQYDIGPDIDLDEDVVLDKNGERITEERAEQMAEQALEQVRRSGRPSLSGEKTHSPRVAFRVADKLNRRAQKVAHRQGKTVSQLGRDALEKYVDEAER